MIDIPPLSEIQSDATQTILLAVIQSVEVLDKHPYIAGITYYQHMGAMEVVDLTAVQCVVGRITDHGKWAIIDRSRLQAQATFDLD